jgi:hypothetical protein
LIIRYFRSLADIYILINTENSQKFIIFFMQNSNSQTFMNYPSYMYPQGYGGYSQMPTQDSEQLDQNNQ